MSTQKTLNLGAIVLDSRLQSRTEINEDNVADYAHDMEQGDKFPAITVHFDGINYYLTDGFHRYMAAKRLDRASILCDVINGTFRDAQLYSTGVNSKHGMRRTYADKRKAVMTLLEDFEWSQWSNAEIARQCGVSAPFVKNLRESGSQTPATVKYTTSTGEVAERKAKNENKNRGDAGAKPDNPKKEEPVEEPKQDSQLDASKELIEILQAEIQQLRDKLAMGFMEGTEEEKGLAAQTIAELREELRITKIELEAVKISRGTFQNENHQMRKQITMLQKKLKQQGVES